MTTTPVLEVDEITVRFGGLTANSEVSLQVAEGAIAGLIGPNGAGKTTLFNVISGVQAPTSGRVRFCGEDVTQMSMIGRARKGMARTFQNLSIVPSLSVLDNASLGVGRFRTHGLVPSMLRLPGATRQDRQIRNIAQAALAFVGLADSATRATGDLPYGDRRRLELARALALQPRLLLLDEPSAGMGPAETASLAQIIQRARGELGISVLVVEHDMSFVRTLAEVTTVLEFGEVIASGPTEDTLADARVAEAYLGSTGAALGQMESARA